MDRSYLVKPQYQTIYERIDKDDAATRCHRYGYGYNSRDPPNRRIFLASLVADDDLNVVKMHATEAYGLYEAMVLVEANTTFVGTPRKFRFFGKDTPGYQLLRTGLFGPSTRIVVETQDDQNIRDQEGILGLFREHIQRDYLSEMLRRVGMQQDDVAIVSDIDEVFMRDYLLAVKTCEIPEFILSNHECKNPKIVPKTLNFESSPDCVARYDWFHPDIILGACIQGVGDSIGRPQAERQLKHIYSRRKEGYGGRGPEDYIESIKGLGRYPLWTPTDFRATDGAYQSRRGHYKGRTGQIQEMDIDVKSVEGVYGFIAYHFHNFFQSTEAVRHKYGTFGHPIPNAATIPFEELSKDIDMSVRCALQMNHSTRDQAKPIVKDGWNAIQGLFRPIYWMDENLRQDRVNRLKEIIRDDVKKYGSSYAHGNQATD